MGWGEWGELDGGGGEGRPYRCPQGWQRCFQLRVVLAYVPMRGESTSSGATGTAISCKLECVSAAMCAHLFGGACEQNCTPARHQ